MNIMIDVDGVMNTLLETACEITGIDYEKVRQYSLADLDPAEKSLIIQQFHSVECFRRSWVIPTIKEENLMKKLCELAEVTVHSLSFTEDIKDFKLTNILRLYPPLSEKNIRLDVVGMGDAKEVGSYDIIIEDCFTNVMKAREINNNCIGIIINHSYNEDEVANMVNSNNIIVRTTFEDALSTALELVYDEMERDRIDKELADEDDWDSHVVYGSEDDEEELDDELFDWVSEYEELRGYEEDELEDTLGGYFDDNEGSDDDNSDDELADIAMEMVLDDSDIGDEDEYLDIDTDDFDENDVSMEVERADDEGDDDEDSDTEWLLHYETDIDLLEDLMLEQREQM